MKLNHFLLLIAFGLTAINCKKETSENEMIFYNVSVSSTNGGNVNTTGGTYASGSQIQLIATADTDYYFVGWSNGSNENPLPILINQNLNIRANFLKKRVALTVLTNGNGTVEQELLSSSKNKTDYTIGSQIRLTAIPEENWSFLSWGGDITSSNNPLEISLNSTKTYLATFTENNSNAGTNQGVMLSAYGQGDTYGLITSILAPGYNPIETPDCNHAEFGDHITSTYDIDLEKYVFQFHIHVTPDNDRCINFDRQRNEIKTYNQSPENLLGRQGETVTYSWKFKLAEGFQSSPKFTHIHQLKSVGGEYSSMPMYTLTTRKSTPDRLELRYAETDQQITLQQIDLAPLINRWIEVSETINYTQNGNYTITLIDVLTQVTLLSHTNESAINWREGAEFVRPKWGIYRSLLYPEDLRDETVLFADFQIIE